MQLGLSWQHSRPEGELDEWECDEWERALELRPQWTKFPVTMGKPFEQMEADEFAWCVECQEAGIRPVIDLRTDNISAFGHSAPPLGWRWEHGRWRHEALFDGYASWAGQLAKRLGGLCNEYEAWGEAPCMHMSQRFFEGTNYVDLLRATHAALKAANPECRVWFAGHGVNADPSFWRYASQLGASDYYDVNNLHPFMHDRSWPQVKGLLETLFATMREVEAERGDPMRLLGMTEFGWPTHPDGSGIPFKSHVQDSVLSCSEEEQAEWLDKSFTLFERNGVDVVIIDKLRDSEGDHWGAHCGLYRRDWTEKPAVEVFRAWAARGAEKEVSL